MESSVSGFGEACLEEVGVGEDGLKRLGLQEVGFGEEVGSGDAGVEVWVEFLIWQCFSAKTLWAKSTLRNRETCRNGLFIL